VQLAASLWVAHRPNADHAVLAAAEEALGVGAACNSGHGLVVCVDLPEEFAGLWAKSTELAVRPARDECFAVDREREAGAGDVWHADAQELAQARNVPEAEFCKGSCRKNLHPA
jgi:hypothetical protein